MALPSIQELQDLTRQRVLDADRQNTLHNLTPKLLRRGIEKEFDLDEGDLDAAEYRSTIKQAIEATMAEIETEKSHAVAQVATKADPSTKTKTKRRSLESEADEGPKKRTKANHKQGDGDKKSAKSKRKPAAEAKTCSLQEQMMDDSAVSQQEKPPAKQEKEIPLHIDASEDRESMEGAKAVPQVAKAVPSDIRSLEGSSSSSLSREKSNAKTEYKSESELSVLIDEPLKRKRKKKVEVEDGNAKRRAKGKVKKSENLSKDEETIQKLKSFVVACGVRRVWSKVFEGLDTPAQQIKKLKEILHELGMTGRLSLEKARAIREKREFAQELQDVQEFQKAIMKSGRKQHVTATNDDKHAGDSEGEEDENPKTRRRKMNAAQSISAFLGDQSSDEDS